MLLQSCRAAALRLLPADDPSTSECLGVESRLLVMMPRSKLIVLPRARKGTDKYRHI